MPSFNNTQLNYRARNSNKVTVLIGDQPIGFAQTISPTIDFGTQQLYGVGNALPQEVQQLRVSPHITIDAFSLTQNGLKLLGYPADMQTVLANNEFNFAIKDGITGTIIATYVGGVCGNFNQSIPANQMVVDAMSFLCADVLDQNGNSIVAMGDAYQFPALAGNVNGVASVVS